MNRPAATPMAMTAAPAAIPAMALEPSDEDGPGVLVAELSGPFVCVVEAVDEPVGLALLAVLLAVDVVTTPVPAAKNCACDMLSGVFEPAQLVAKVWYVS